MFGSPLRLNASAPALPGSRDINSGPPDRGPFVGQLLRLARRHALFRPHKRQGNVVRDGHWSLLCRLVSPSIAEFSIIALALVEAEVAPVVEASVVGMIEDAGGALQGMAPG